MKCWMAGCKGGGGRKYDDLESFILQTQTLVITVFFLCLLYCLPDFYSVRYNTSRREP